MVFCFWEIFFEVRRMESSKTRDQNFAHIGLKNRGGKCFAIVSKKVSECILWNVRTVL